MTPELLIEQAKLIIRWAESLKSANPIVIEERCLTGNGKWYERADPRWNLMCDEYREKPKPRECWFVAQNGIYASTDKQMAELHAREVGGTVVHMREVTEE